MNASFTTPFVVLAITTFAIFIGRDVEALTQRSDGLRVGANNVRWMIHYSSFCWVLWWKLRRPVSGLLRSKSRSSYPPLPWYMLPSNDVCPTNQNCHSMIGSLFIVWSIEGCITRLNQRNRWEECAGNAFMLWRWTSICIECAFLNNIKWSLKINCLEYTNKTLSSQVVFFGMWRCILHAIKNSLSSVMNHSFGLSSQLLEELFTDIWFWVKCIMSLLKINKPRSGRKLSLSSAQCTIVQSLGNGSAASIRYRFLV